MTNRTPVEAIEARSKKWAAKREAKAAQERSAVRAEKRRDRKHQNDPRVVAYRAEREAKKARDARVMDEAKAAYARLMADIQDSRTRGRPKTICIHRDPADALIAALAGREQAS
ncbi:MAG TPA: hypothetical protein VN903_14355 [Polyangia bacterium]|nr:hypothetical protein [Polyangia bacterium]